MSGVQVSKLHTFQGHRDAVYTLEPSSGDPVFYSAGGDGMVVKWNFMEPDQGHLVAKVPNSVYALQYISNRKILVVGQNFQGIHIIDLTENKEIGSLALTDSAIFDMQLAGNRLLVATGSGTVYQVDLEMLSVTHTISLSTKSARCIAINERAGEFAVGYSDHMVRVYDLESLKVKYELASHTNSVFTVAYHPSLPLLVSAGRDAHIKTWDRLNHYTLEHSIAAHMYAINHLEFSPNGQHFVTCSMDKSIKVWDADLFKLLKVIDKVRYAGHGTSVNKLYWSPYNQQLASCSDDRTITVWDLKT